MKRPVRRKRERGFTLIELMISLVLFSIVIAGVFSVAVSTTVGFREQRDLVVTEISVRAPMEYIADVIRNASPAAPTGNIQDAYTCTDGAITIVNANNAPDQLEVVYAAGAVATTLRSDFSFAPMITSFTVTDPRQFAVGDSILVTDLTEGHVLTIQAIDMGTGLIDVIPPTCLPPALHAPGLLKYGPGAYVVRVARARIFVDVAGACCNGVPTLMVDPDGAGLAAAEPLAENIEDMQVSLGIDQNLDKGITDPNEWQFSETVGNLGCASSKPPCVVRAIRVTLTARAPRALPGSATFARTPAEDRTAAVDNPVPDGFRRRVLTSTIEIRNMGGSP